MCSPHTARPQNLQTAFASLSHLMHFMIGMCVSVRRVRRGGRTTLVLKQPKRQPDLAHGSHHKPPTLPVPDSGPAIARKHFQLPSASFFNTTRTAPRIRFASPPGESTYEAVKERHSTAQPPSRKVKSLVSGMQAFDLLD